MKKVDERIIRMYDHIESSGFRLELLNEIYAYMAEFLELSFEMSEIKYIDEISLNSNWKVFELRTDLIPDDFNIEDIISPENESQLALLRLNAMILYMNLYTLVYSDDIEDLEEKMYEIGDSFWESYKDGDEMLFIPPYNNILDEIFQELELNNEVVIFYDMWYMPEIEQGLLSSKFEHQSEKEFDLFCLHSDIGDNEDE